MDNSFLLFSHSLLRYLVLLSVAYAGSTHLVGYLRGTPILTVERTGSIVALALCHIQLGLGLTLYLTRYSTFADMAHPFQQFWKYEHISTMIIAITLVTVGRILSKRAFEEPKKQIRVGIFYLIALALMLWAIPWPSTAIGHGKPWI